MKKPANLPDLNRRDFLKGGSLSGLMALMGGIALKAQDQNKTAATPAEPKAPGNPVKCAVIGCGAWGREILRNLARLPNAPVVAICDTYEAFMRRAKESAPKAETYSDYRKVLEQKEVQAVFVATPSHQHREITLAALQAGKHVYCEAPLASTLEDARAIAQAAKGAIKQYFQSGLNFRSDPQRHFLLSFIRTGAMGKNVMARSQWHKKQSWRRTSPNPDREKELNWRLRKESSIGLIGEIGVHQVDAASWILRSPPQAVTGFGSIAHWNDGRDVADTIQAVFEYPDGVNLIYHSTLANSFDAEYEMYYGTDAALMVRDGRAWMFKEVDSALLGWEVYARKDSFYKETGIALVADASKSTTQGNKPGEEIVADPPLYYALEAFLANTNLIQTDVEDFIASYGEADKAALKDYLGSHAKNFLPASGYKEGFEAAVSAIKANEAIQKRQRIAFSKEWFEIG